MVLHREHNKLASATFADCPVITTRVISPCLLYIFLILGPSLGSCVVFAPEVALQGDRVDRFEATKSLAAAENYAENIRSQIVYLETESSLIKSSTSLALFGTSGATVGVAAFDASKQLITGLGLGTAGLLGFQYAIAVSAKQAILDNAREAIDCAIASAEQIATAPIGTANAPSGETSGNTGTARLSNLSPLSTSGELVAAPLDYALVDADKAMESFIHSGTEATQLSLGAATRTIPSGTTLPRMGTRSAAIFDAEIQRKGDLVVAGQLFSQARSLMQEAADSNKQVMQDLPAGLDDSSKAARFLVRTATDIEDATIQLLHSSEPIGQDLVGKVKSNIQDEIGSSSKAIDNAKTQTKANSNTAKQATRLADQGTNTASAASSADAMAQGETMVANGNQAQQKLDTAAAQLDVIGKVVSNEDQCRSLSKLAE